MIKSTNPLDIALGMEYYSRPELFLGSGVYLRLSPDTFKVYEEVYGLGVASAPSRPPDVIVCSPRRKILAVMCKRGVSTLEAALVMRRIGVVLNYWGVKDAEAETCQFVVLRCLSDAEVPPDSFRGVSLYQIKLLDPGFTPRRLQLAGNLFEVLLSYAGVDPRYVAETVIATEGLSFLNYFGYQRFGTVRPITHVVGRAVATRDYDSALNYLVGYTSAAESPKVRRARELFTEGRYRESLRTFPRSFSIERSVLKKYVETMDAREAVTKGVPHSLLRFFVEAYQSYLFNKALSLLAGTVGGIGEVERECEVLELPRPDVSPEGCGKYARETVLADLGGDADRVDKALFVRSVRESVFRVRDLRVTTVSGGTMKLSFRLGRGSYATVYLRELLRESMSL